MKKIITFLFCASVFSSAFAQRDNNWNNRNTTVVYGNSNYGPKNYQQDNDRDNRFDKKYYQNNKYAIQQRDMEIQKVNYKYDIQVKQVIDNRFFTRKQKKNIIKTLKNQKNQEINTINFAYTDACNDNNQRYNDHDRDGRGR
jgi:hypothetical protein